MSALLRASVWRVVAIVQNSSAGGQSSTSCSDHEQAVCAGASWLFDSDVVRVLRGRCHHGGDCGTGRFELAAGNCVKFQDGKYRLKLSLRESRHKLTT